MTYSEGLIHNQMIKVQYSSSYSDPNRIIKNMFDYDYNTFYCTPNISESFFQIDFLDAKVKIQSYSIRVGDWKYNFPYSWNATGFNGNYWVVLSTITKETSLTTPRSNNTFEIDPSKRHFSYSSIRLTSTGKNYPESYNSYYFCLAEFDISGTVQNMLSLNDKSGDNLLFNIKAFVSILFLT